MRLRAVIRSVRARGSIHDGLEVKRVASPDGAETFLLCRSADRREKEKAMHERFAQRIEEGSGRDGGGGRRIPGGSPCLGA